MSSEAPHFLAIEIGGTKLQLALADLQGRWVVKKRLSVGTNQTANGIQQLIEATIAELPVKPNAVGIGFGGPINRKTGSVVASHQIPGWTNFPLQNWLQAQLQVPVMLENDANAAALAEALQGIGQSYSSVFYVTLGSGVGGGMVVAGQLYRGELPGECEIGHVQLDRSGTTLESQCCGWAIDQKVQEAIQVHPTSVLAQLAHNNTNSQYARLLSPALLQHDPVAQRILEQLADDLAFGFSHVVNLFHPAALILGGGLSLIGDRLREAVSQRLANYLMPEFRPGPSIHLAGLGEEVVLVGAFLLAQNLYLSIHSQFVS